MTHYKHWRDIPISKWRWKDFTPEEIASNGDGSIIVDEAALDTLQHARDIVGKPFKITSAYRDPKYNKKVGGAQFSKHKKGIAFDISLDGHNKAELIGACYIAGFKGFGIQYNSFIHVDTRLVPARW